jgi:hypothetical protein
MTAEQSALPPALRMPRPELVRYTLAPVVTDAGQAAQMAAEEERFYDLVVADMVAQVEREMATKATDTETKQPAGSGRVAGVR